MSRKRKSARAVGHGWIGTLFGALGLAVLGFVGGIAAGLVMEEPELVLGHLWGRGIEVPLAAAGEETTEALAQGEGPPLGSGAAGSAPAPELRPVSAPPPAAGAPASGGWAIQVGAFREPGQARSTVERLHGAGFPAYVVEGRKAAVRYRVRVGPVATRAGAEQLARRLRDDHDLPTWIVSREG